MVPSLIQHKVHIVYLLLRIGGVHSPGLYGGFRNNRSQLVATPVGDVAQAGEIMRFYRVHPVGRNMQNCKAKEFRR